MERANNIAYTATDTHPVPVKELTEERAIYLDFGEEDEYDDVLRCDERITAPIYNYARFLPWMEAVEKVLGSFAVVSERVHRHESVDPSVDWVTGDRTHGQGPRPHWTNRIGTTSQIAQYCQGGAHRGHTRSMWGPNVCSRIALASALAFMLQWCSVGAAFTALFYTPTTGESPRILLRPFLTMNRPVGLGCRSAAYLLFGALSTIVWLLLLFSSFLAHYALTQSAYTRIENRSRGEDILPSLTSIRLMIARHLAIMLRRLAKVLATIDALWVLIVCLLQFSNFFDS